jgi:hypothetical protein
MPSSCYDWVTAVFHNGEFNPIRRPWFGLDFEELTIRKSWSVWAKLRFEPQLGGPLQFPSQRCLFGPGNKKECAGSFRRVHGNRPPGPGCFKVLNWLLTAAKKSRSCNSQGLWTGKSDRRTTNLANQPAQCCETRNASGEHGKIEGFRHRDIIIVNLNRAIGTKHAAKSHDRSRPTARI